MNATLHPTTLDTQGGDLFTWIAFAALSIAGAGLAYPLIATLLGGALFPHQAAGSLVEVDGRVVGSELVAQPFADPRYFVPRPSAAGYAGMGLAGSNMAPSNPALRERIAADSAAIATREGIDAKRIPVDLVTASGGGWDPHVSPEAAEVQVERVARARGMDADAVRALVREHTEGPTFGVFGQRRVNVLLLNLSLDSPSPGGG